MLRPRPPGAAAARFSTRGLVILLLALNFNCNLLAVAAAQQQHPQRDGRLDSPRENPLSDTVVPPHASPPLRDGNNHKHHHHPGPAQKRRNANPPPLAAHNERAIATLAPVDSHPAVRAPSARPTGATGGLSTRRPARSLQDWEVEDFVLLATVDGTLHARDRKTGAYRWHLETEKPMVDTIYHRRNHSENKEPLIEDERLWIVEPSQDGALYIYTPGSKIGMERLHYTVRQLAEDWSPYAGEDPPVVYTAEKRNTLYTVDASSGKPLKMFSTSGPSILNDNKSCRLISGLEGLDEEACESTATITLSRTEYTVRIQDRSNGDPICTISYFEWGPNNRDRDLHHQYSRTFDDKYIYSNFDGSINTWDYAKLDGPDPLYPERPVWRQKFASPVVRAFDIAHPLTSDNDASLVILPQPKWPTFDWGPLDHVFVNLTESGSWYALSESSYPTVTNGAAEAEVYKDLLADVASSWTGKTVARQDSRLIGVHSTFTMEGSRPIDIPNMGGSESWPTLDGPEVDPNTADQPLLPDKPNSHYTNLSALKSSGTWGALAILVCFLGFLVTPKLRHSFTPSKLQQIPSVLVPSKSSVEKGIKPVTPVVETVPTEDERRVKFVEDELEAEMAERSSSTESAMTAIDQTPRPSTPPNQLDSMHSNDPENAGSHSPSADGVEDSSQQETPKPKKKAHRGQRGGRNRRRPRKSNDEALEKIAEGKVAEGIIKQIDPDKNLQADENTINALNIDEMSGTIQINSLSIKTDRVLGSGSGGTFVFEGTFEGRDVAVKRMLPQYYELASQEVNLLQQSDDHPNVIRYFCQQKDANFLYIAVELCQASLWDLYKDGRPDDEWKEEYGALVNQINSDVPRALYQLAAGLTHLHNLRIIHRDIKPQNILIAYPKKGQTGGPRFVISDFGLCKSLPENMSTLMATTGNAGTVGWKAPELIMQPKDSEGRTSSNPHSRESSASGDNVSSYGVKRNADIFSLGCVFYYVLTNGGHPFDDLEGWAQLRELNIKKNKCNFTRLKDWGDDSVEPMHLISWMLENKPERRPTALQVLQHPFFWSPEKRLNFLCDVSDHWEREPRDPPSYHLEVLEEVGPAVFGVDFLAQLPVWFKDTLGKQRKYTGSRMLDLLRALRNKKNHYEDMDKEVQRKVGPLPYGYLRFWTTRFPNLLMECYNVVLACGLEEEHRFRPYFSS
ncbi:MAG: bifunctional endoribonuclease/protein kinase ire1 [Bathelium mastoideum]|nr:MAG: bifunctional endoribonuclease/protein kinase ire1 [Bathelium mastoideum]